MRRILLAAALLLAALPASSHAAGTSWTCDGSYRPLGAMNGPGAYRFRPASGMAFRFIADTGSGTFSVSSRTGSSCEVRCLHTNVPYANVRDCSVPALEEILVTVSGGEAFAIAENPASQPGGGVPLPGPLPNDPLLTDPGCEDCLERVVRASDTVPADLESLVVVKGQRAGDRYVLTITIDGAQPFPPISVEDNPSLPNLELGLIPSQTPFDLDVIARYHAGEARCPVAVGDPNACAPTGPMRAPRDDARWREAGMLVRVLPNGPELFVPYLGQLCAGHAAPNAPEAQPC